MQISQKTIATKPRVLLNAVAGWGKTTTIAQAPSPVILMSPDETGYYTLLNQGHVKNVDSGVIESFDDLLKTIDKDITPNDKYKTLAIDALGGLERMIHEKVCDERFHGDWGEKGFQGFQRGYDISLQEFRRFIASLDRCNQAGKLILLTSHAAVTNVKNPLGPDYDHFAPDLHRKTYALFERWTDAILFGTYQTIVEKDETKKWVGVGGSQRIVYTQRTDAYEAKNRYRMPEVIYIEDDPGKMFRSIFQHMAPTKKEEKE